jgi:putative ABC transport system permease protein
MHAMNALTQDLRLGLRTLRRHPGFCAVVVLTLALGIGGTTAIFSFIDGVLLRPLPFPDPGRLVMPCEQAPQGSGDWCGASPSNLGDWSRASRSFEVMGLARDWPFHVGAEGAAVGVDGGIATPSLFEVFRVRPSLGRLFRADESTAGHEHVALASHGYWKSRLGGDPAAVGRSLTIDGEPYTLVGVLPVGFEVPELSHADLWIPLWPPSPHRADYRRWRGFRPFARLAEGATIETARAELTTIAAGLEKEYPDTNAGWRVTVESLRDRIVGSVRPALVLFLCAVGLVLLVACANVAHLMLARATSREREFAVRAALGAGRGRLVRQLLAEGLVFAAIGGAVGLLLASWVVELVVGLAPSSFPRLGDVHVNLATFGFAALVSCLSALLFSLPPALAAGRADLARSLGDARQGGARRGHVRLRGLLATGEIALALMLVIVAGLLMRSFATLVAWKPGFDRNNLTAVQIILPQAKYPDRRNVTRLYQRAVEEVRALPGVVAAEAASAGPLFGGDGAQEVTAEGHPIPAGAPRPEVLWYDVGPDYFRTLGVPLMAGRWLTERDDATSEPVAVINETMARRLWPGEDPIGRHVHLETHQMTVSVVGVVGDTRPFRPDAVPEAEIYWPYAQVPRWAIQIFMRSAVPPATLVPAVRARLEALDPEMSIGRFETLDERVAQAVVNPRFNMTLIALFAFVAAAIAVVGVYGVLSFSVARRTHEIGVRVALGARPGAVLRLILGQGLRITLAGLVLGIAGAAGLAGLLRGLVVGVSPGDPVTLIAAAAVLASIALGACALPALRAIRINPAEALRRE